jgi:hypothetical protein
MNQLHYIACYLLLLCGTANAQPYDFVCKNLSQEDGLPSNEAYYVFEDSRHYLWFATDKGVVRFDGKNMQRFDLPDNVIFRIYEDVKGRIWFFGYGCRFAYFHNNRIHSYPYNHQIRSRLEGLIIKNAWVDALHNDSIVLTCLGATCHIDGSGNVTVERPKVLADATGQVFSIAATPTAWLVKASRQQTHSYPTLIHYSNGPRQLQFSLPQTPIVALGTAAAIPFYDRGCIFYAGKTLARLTEDGQCLTQQLPGDILSVEIHGDKLLVGTKINGLHLLDTALRPLQTVPSLDQLSITCTRIDYEGGLWCTSLEKGVFYIKSLQVLKHTHPDLNGIPQYRLWGLPSGGYLSAGANGIFHCKGMAVAPIYKHHFANIIYDLLVNSNKLVVANSESGLSNGGQPLYISTSLGEYRLYNITATSEMARQDSFYSCMVSRGYKKLDRHSLQDLFAAQRELPVVGRTLYPSTPSTVWVGGNTGLFQYNEALHQLKPFRPGDARLESGVNTIRPLPNGWLAIGTRFNGILLIQDTQVVAHINEANGLLANPVKYLLPWGNQLWAATAKGLSVISFHGWNPLRYTIHPIGQNLGMFNVIIHQLLPLQQQLLVATSNGLYCIQHPAALLQQKVPPLPFFIQQVRYHGGDTAGMASITLPYQHNWLSVAFNAICFNTPDDVQYYYRFNGTDTAWQTLHQAALLLSNLSPGRYVLQMKAGLNHGQRMSAVQQLTIVVQKPWWQMTGVRLLFVALLVTGLSLLYFNRIRSIQRREVAKASLRNKMAHLEQTALRSQLNPHFIFNCLSSIQQLVITGHTAEANEYLIRFATLIRKTLELSGNPFISLADEIDYLTEYLHIEQLRLPDRFVFDIQTKGPIDRQQTLLPNMMIQPLVENAVKHGVKPLRNRLGQIDICFEQTPEGLRCTIADNGVGRHRLTAPLPTMGNTGSATHGLHIIRKRLQALAETSDTTFLFEILDRLDTDNNPAGTTIVLLLPIQQQNNDKGHTYRR